MTVSTSWTSISDISKKTRVAFVLQKVSNCLYKDQQHQVNNFQNGNTLLDAKTITLYINQNDNALYVIIHYYGFIMTMHCDNVCLICYGLSRRLSRIMVYYVLTITNSLQIPKKY